MPATMLRRTAIARPSPGSAARCGSASRSLLVARRRAQACAALSTGAAAAAAAAAVQGPAAAEKLLAEHTAAAEHVLFTLADSPAELVDAPAVVQRAGTWLGPFVEGLETVLKFFQSGLQSANVPYSYGFSIILLTLCIKVATYPLVKKQVESTMAVAALKPRLDLLKKRFGDDKDRVTKETNVMYEQAGVDPLAGCLPTLATIPVFIGLYSSLTNAATDGLFDTEGFFWIPSLAGPTTVAARQAGSGIAWLLPLVDGAPPIGWDEASRYLVLPALLLASMYASNAVVAPPVDPEDPNAGTSRALQLLLPLMVGFFSLNVPSGLTLYYFSNSVMTTAVQIYLKKLGGANVVMNELGPVTKPGSGRRLGVAVSAFQEWAPQTVKLTKDDEPAPEVDPEVAAKAAAEARAAAAAAAEAEAARMLDPASVSRRVKRKSLLAIADQQEAGRRVALAAAKDADDAAKRRSLAAAMKSAGAKDAEPQQAAELKA